MKIEMVILPRARDGKSTFSSQAEVLYVPESKNDKFFYGRGRIQTINYSGTKGTTPYTFGLSGYMRQAYPSKKWP